MRNVNMSTRSLYRDERGMSLVFVGMGFMGFVAATMLAIDVGMLMTARSQAQNSADAGAHAGAVALAFQDYYDRSASGPAVTNAVARATENQVMSENVSVTPADVEFLTDPTGEPNRVKVTVYRTAARGNPLGLFIAPLFGVATADVPATATAEASPANVPSRCFPFMIPDKWTERTDPPFNSETSYYDLFDNKKDPLPVPDVYVPPGEPGYTGYDPIRDKGSLVILKASNSTKVSPSAYNPLVIPGTGTGADSYRANILAGPCADFAWKQPLTLEPGNMVGPTSQGIADLVAMDPDAHWNDVCQCIQGRDPKYGGTSPREGAIPLYDPDYYERGMQTGRNADFRTANYLGVFIEGMRGNDLIARIVPLAGRRNGDEGIPGAMFLKAIRIIQ